MLLYLYTFISVLHTLSFLFIFIIEQKNKKSISTMISHKYLIKFPICVFIFFHILAKKKLSNGIVNN